MCGSMQVAAMMANTAMDVRWRRFVMVGYDLDTHNRVIVMDPDEVIKPTYPLSNQVLVIDILGNIHGVRKRVPSPQIVVRPHMGLGEADAQWSFTKTSTHGFTGPGIQSELYERNDLFILPNFHNYAHLFKRIHSPTFIDSRVPVCALSDFGIFSLACLFDSKLCTYLSTVTERLTAELPPYANTMIENSLSVRSHHKILLVEPENRITNAF